MSDFYEEKIRAWWNGLPQPTRDQIHKSAVDNHMDSSVASTIINSPNFFAGPTYTEWVGNGDGAWHWSESMRQVILEETDN